MPNVRIEAVRRIALQELAKVASVGRTKEKESMGRLAPVLPYVLVMVAVVVGLDVPFFRNRFWERLMANVGIVLVFLAFYLRFLKRP